MLTRPVADLLHMVALCCTEKRVALCWTSGCARDELQRDLRQTLSLYLLLSCCSDIDDRDLGSLGVQVISITLDANSA